MGIALQTHPLAIICSAFHRKCHTKIEHAKGAHLDQIYIRFHRKNRFANFVIIGNLHCSQSFAVQIGTKWQPFAVQSYGSSCAIAHA